MVNGSLISELLEKMCRTLLFCILCEEIVLDPCFQDMFICQSSERDNILAKVRLRGQISQCSMQPKLNRSL